MATQNFHPKVDDYIAKAKPFAQPILNHLRELLHKACPEIEETIKWSRPFFQYRGLILCQMAAFKEHCTFGFWDKEMSAALREAKLPGKDASDAFGRITRMEDLPHDKAVLGWIRQAASSVENGQYKSPISARSEEAKPKKAAVKAPQEFTAALQRNKKAAAGFATLSPSCKREYIEWIADAKRPETRDKRIATALEWIAEGKQRNWKYQNC